VVQENLIANLSGGNKSGVMFRLTALFVFFHTLIASAGQLDLALVQFPEVKTAIELNAALEGVNLAEITNADRTVTKVPALQGGRVVFFQSLPSTDQLASSTRLGNSRADIAGTFKNHSLRLEIGLSEGVDDGLRRFSSRTYSGSAPLSFGAPRVVAVRTTVAKKKSVTKGTSEVKETVSCFVILAQLR
jgi:hypothetical protein